MQTSSHTKSFPKEIRQQICTDLTFAEGVEKFGYVTGCKHKYHRFGPRYCGLQAVTFTQQASNQYKFTVGLIDFC